MEEFWGPSEITDEDLRHYEKQCNESQGFDVDCLPVGAGNIIRPLLPLTPSRIETHRLVPLTAKAVEFYNSENPRYADQIEDPLIVKANYLFSGSPMTYYITFKAKDASRKWKVYQTKVDADVTIKGSEIQVCRLKPKKEKKMKKKKRSSAKGKEKQSTNTSGFLAASPSAEPANADPHPAREAEEAVEPLKSTGGMEEQGEGTAQN